MGGQHLQVLQCFSLRLLLATLCISLLLSCCLSSFPPQSIHHCWPWVGWRGVEVDGRTVVAGFLPQKPLFFQPHTSSLTKEWSAGCKISLGEYLVRYVWVDVLRNVWAKILKFHCHHLVGSSISSAFASPSSSWLIVAAAPLFSSSCS